MMNQKIIALKTGVFQIVVAGGFPFQGIKGSVKGKRQFEIQVLIM